MKPNIVGQVEDVELLTQMVDAKRGITALNLFTINSKAKNLKTIGKELALGETIYLISKVRNTPHPIVVEINKKFKIQSN